LLAIVATANHYWIDAAVAGVLVVAAATVLNWTAHRERQLDVAALAAIPVARPVWTPAIPSVWARSLASNDAPRPTVPSDDWFAELEAGGFDADRPESDDRRLLVPQAG
jgi:hypothetical protein